MTTETETTAREQIRALLNDRAAAITARDAHRAVAHHAPEVVSFGLAPPLRYAGDEVRDRQRSHPGGAGPGGQRAPGNVRAANMKVFR